tara:strand:- start:98 stop:280 length:183 start_codon:yes stop_codon:yes gene_type:complete
MNTVEVTIKQVYGKELIYPANKNAERFANIAGTRTLSASVLQNAKALGFEITVSAPQLSI